MTSVKIKIDMDNAAFEDTSNEFTRILSQIIDNSAVILSRGESKLYDINGNEVGSVRIT